MLTHRFDPAHITQVMATLTQEDLDKPVKTEGYYWVDITSLVKDNPNEPKKIDLKYSYKTPDEKTHTDSLPRENYSNPLQLRHSNGTTHVLVVDCRLHAVSNSPVPRKRPTHHKEGIYPSDKGIEDIRY